jgi:hypothetical protein
MKRELLGYTHPSTPRKKTFKTQTGTEKCILTVFWDYKGNFHLSYMVGGYKINSETFVKTPES